MCEQIPSTVSIRVFGDRSVGKTSLIRRFMLDEWCLQRDSTTEDLSYYKELRVGGRKRSLEIIDSGNARFPNSKELQEAAIFVLVFDGTSRSSWSWIDECRRELPGPWPPHVYLVENKCESAGKLVDGQGMHVAHEMGWHFIRTSAKKGVHIGQLFEGSLRAYFAQTDRDGEEREAMDSVWYHERRSSFWESTMGWAGSCFGWYSALD